MRFVLLATLWLSQRLGHCRVERHHGTVLGTLIQLPLLVQCVIFVNLKQLQSAIRHNTDQLNNSTLKSPTV